MFLYGAGGHCKVIIEVIRSLNSFIVECVYDDNPRVDEILDVEVSKPKGDFKEGSKCIISIGSNYIRKEIAEKLNVDFVSAIHPKAVVSNSSVLGEGTVVMAGAVINAEAKIGKHCVINTASVIEHDCIINDYVHISPNAALAGNVEVGEGSHVGIGACVIQGIKIGKWTVVGAGSVVVRDVPDYATIVGNPAKVIRISKKI